MSKAPVIEIFFSKVEYPGEILRKFSEQNSIVSAWLDYLTSWLASENWKFVQLWKFHKDLGNIFGGIAKRYETVWIKVFLHDTIRVGHYMEKPLITWKKYQTWKTWKVQKKYKNLEGRNYKSRNYKFFFKNLEIKKEVIVISQNCFVIWINWLSNYFIFIFRKAIRLENKAAFLTLSWRKSLSYMIMTSVMEELMWLTLDCG